MTKRQARVVAGKEASQPQVHGMSLKPHELARREVNAGDYQEMTEALFEEVLARVRCGTTFSAALIELRIRRREFYQFKSATEVREHEYEDARERCIEAWVDDMFRIADDPTIPADHKKVMCDVRKWWASHMRPQKYGDKTPFDQLLANGIQLSITTNYEPRLPNAADLPTNSKTGSIEVTAEVESDV
jgi:hypothetical protein